MFFSPNFVIQGSYVLTIKKLRGTIQVWRPQKGSQEIYKMFNTLHLATNVAMFEQFWGDSGGWRVRAELDGGFAWSSHPHRGWSKVWLPSKLWHVENFLVKEQADLVPCQQKLSRSSLLKLKKFDWQKSKTMGFCEPGCNSRVTWELTTQFWNHYLLLRDVLLHSDQWFVRTSSICLVTHQSFRCCMSHPEFCGSMYLGLQRRDLGDDLGWLEVQPHPVWTLGRKYHERTQSQEKCRFVSIMFF